MAELITSQHNALMRITQNSSNKQSAIQQSYDNKRRLDAIMASDRKLRTEASSILFTPS